MIFNARKKRDRHLFLIEKANERIKSKRTMDLGKAAKLVESINDENKNKAGTVSRKKSEISKKSLGFNKIGAFVSSLREKKTGDQSPNVRRNRFISEESQFAS